MTDPDVSDDMLMAYVDGELDETARRDLAAAIAADPGLAARAARFARSAGIARDAFAGILDETPPSRLLETVGGVPQDKPAGASRRTMARAILPLAACLLLAAGLGAGYWLGQGSAPQSRLFAGEQAVATALATQPSGDARPLAGSGDARLAVLGSYPIPAGLCRSFTLADAGVSYWGVGCDRGEGFAVDMAIAGPPTTGGFVPASEATAQSLDAYLSAVGAGSPLGPREEAERLGLD